MTREGVGAVVFKRILVILGILVAIDLVAAVGGAARRRFDGWWGEYETRSRLQEVAAALNVEYVRGGHYPSDPESFVLAKLGRAAHPLEDHWGHPVTLQLSGDEYEIVSCGPDGECGNADDVAVSGHAPRQY